jgi:hypothetical protein
MIGVQVARVSNVVLALEAYALFSLAKVRAGSLVCDHVLGAGILGAGYLGMPGVHLRATLAIDRKAARTKVVAVSLGVQGGRQDKTWQTLNLPDVTICTGRKTIGLAELSSTNARRGALGDRNGGAN